MAGHIYFRLVVSRSELRSKFHRSSEGRDADLLGHRSGRKCRLLLVFITEGRDLSPERGLSARGGKKEEFCLKLMERGRFSLFGLLHGTLSPFFKSEPIPNHSEMLKKVVGRTFDSSILESAENVFLEGTEYDLLKQQLLRMKSNFLRLMILRLEKFSIQTLDQTNHSSVL